MSSSVDPFHPLLRLMDRYRQDVHHLRPAADPGFLRDAAEHLGQDLPPSLASFLERWNGALLFRGVLRLRSTTELAPVSEAFPHIVLFADGPREDERWAFVRADPGHVFGRWHDEGQGRGRLEPLYLTYHRWLMGLLQLLEQAPRTEEQREDLRLTCDPMNPFLLLRRAETLLAEGAPDRALPLLRQATVSDPGLLPAWQRLGDVLAGQDPGEARFSYIKALRAVRLPLPYPGARGADADLVRSLGALFDPGDAAWERELRDLFAERVADARSAGELDLVETAALAYAQVFLARGDRAEAAAFLDDLLRRCRSFGWQGPLTEPRLLLARLQTELGRHNDAEGCLRPLEVEEDPAAWARARLALGRIVVARQEPWAEEILDEALDGLGDPDDQAQAWLLLAERHLLLEGVAEASACLDRARQRLAATGHQALRAQLALLRGDLARQRGLLADARAAYGEAEDLARRTGDHELAWRLALRAGDLALAAGDRDAARAAWTQAESGFASLSLPVRQAWALLRLGRLGDVEACRKAGALFRAADLAAGVAAVDAVLGVPEASLAWHLDRATEHARVRAEAQRPRPPLERADADRPERRLGAHQAAVAACGVAVVDALGSELATSIRGLESATLRAGDPRLARYVAAVDLLAHHRSYEAARQLLAHLSTSYVTGLPGRALKGALARSPNAALVEGLLDVLGSGQEPVAVARAAEVLGWRRELHAADRLIALVRGEGPPGVRRAAIVALGRIGCREAVGDIAPALELPELGEAASIALLLLGDRQGVLYHSELLDRGDATRGASPGEIVGRYGDPTLLLRLRGSVQRDEELARGALQGLGYLGDVRGIDTLIDATSRPEPRVAGMANAALEVLTGHAEPPEVPDLKVRWRRWWEANEKAFFPGRRYRWGRLLDPALLIARLGVDDLVARSAAYDELVIATGADLPFDADGAWRRQVHHRRAWEAWWREHRRAFTPGTWTFHGQVVG